MVIARGFCVLFSLIFVVKLYRVWLMEGATEAERLPGVAGVRAWLEPRNLLLAAGIAFNAWLGYQFPCVPMLVLCLALLIAYPAYQSAMMQAAPSPARPIHREPEPADVGAPEREKVLAMLEAGKITAEECAELLGALARTSPSASAPRQRHLPDRLVLIGAAMLLIGFFLPWFGVNAGQELNRVTRQIQSTMGDVMSQMPSPVAENMPNLPNFFSSVKTGTIYTAGGEIPHGLGWAILTLGLAAAAIPFFASNLDSRQQRQLVLTALAIGGFLILYLVTQYFRYLHVGIVLAAIAYVVEYLGTTRVERAQSFAPASAMPNEV
jgi:hypothetical protein